jgi:hypothetical protein
MKLIRAVLICGVLVAVAGCGSSSGSGDTQAGATNNPQQAAACLKKQGITLPQRRPANRPPNGGAGGGLFFGGGGGAPRGSSKIQSALRKCGINPQRRGFQASANNPQFKQALDKFVTCVRKNGYDMPAPNTSGNGPVFDASKVNRNDPKFKAATSKCQGDLQALRPPGAPG